MDALAQLMPELQRLGLSAEQQQKVLDYLDKNPGAMPQRLPELSQGEIEGITSMRRADAYSDTARGRLERALANQQSAQGDLMSGISNPRAVPTPFGPVMMRQAPIMNIARAVRAFRSGQDVSSAQGDVENINDQQAKGLGGYLGAMNERNRVGNQNSQRETLAAIIRALGMGA